MINKGLFTSDKNYWETPKDFFNELNEEFNFDLDVASTHENAKTERHFTEEDDGLNQDWTGNVFCNPPYGREISAWVEKAYEESQKEHNRVVVLLIPARTDTRYWHDYIFGKASDIRFLKGRLKFELNGESKQSAPFPSAVIVYRKGEDSHCLMS
jgi:phage N-6-adenine-methyltransferase